MQNVKPYVGLYLKKGSSVSRVTGLNPRLWAR